MKKTSDGAAPDIHTSSENFTQAEAEALLKGSASFVKFRDNFMREGGLFFPNPIDEADFLNLIIKETASDRERIVLIMAMRNWFTLSGVAGASSRPLVFVEEDADGGPYAYIEFPLPGVHVMRPSDVFDRASGRNGVFPFPPPGYLGTKPLGQSYRPHHPDQPEDEGGSCNCAECRTERMDTDRHPGFPENEHGPSCGCDGCEDQGRHLGRTC